MEDGFAREGVLARCNADREATAGDVECKNARRAAVVVAAEKEDERLRALELESQRKLVAMRDRAARQEQAQQDAAAAAKAAAEAAAFFRGATAGYSMSLTASASSVSSFRVMLIFSWL